jgi:Family of unknown function (DUF6205)
MGYLSSVTGEVTITPPLSAAEVRESPFRPDVEERKDIVLRVQEDIVKTNEGTLTRITGTAIVPAWDESYKAYSLEEHLAELIRLHGHGHAFDGVLVVDGSDQGDVWRLVVDDHQVTKETARLSWPDGSEVAL